MQNNDLFWILLEKFHDYEAALLAKSIPSPCQEHLEGAIMPSICCSLRSFGHDMVSPFARPGKAVNKSAASAASL